MLKAKEKTWYEDDVFWETFGPELFTEEKIEAARQEVDEVAALLGLTTDEKILDLCCGIGRHSLELARRGFEVTGFDRTESYLERASQQAQSEGLDVDFVQGDMRKFCALDEFDAVINMYTAFGYFEDPADDRRVLLNVHASLKSGGKLLIDLMGKEVLARIFKPRDWHETNGGLLLYERVLNADWSWINVRWILVKDGQTREFTFGHRLYSAAELSNLLKRSGFGTVEVYGSLSGAPYNHEANRLVVIGTK